LSLFQRTARRARAGVKAALILPAALLPALLMLGCGAAPSGLSKGDEAPGFTLESLSGEEVSLLDFRGKAAVLIHFGTAWCGPCHRQIPALKELHESYSDDELVILYVDLREPRETVSALVEQYGTEYRALLDKTGAVGDAYGVSAIPHNVLIDRQGRVAARPSVELPESAVRELVAGS